MTGWDARGGAPRTPTSRRPVVAVRTLLREKHVGQHANTERPSSYGTGPATFRHPGAERPALCGLGLVALSSRTTTVIGSTGCGKPTLRNLAARLLDAGSGSVPIDGVGVRSMDRRTLAATAGLIAQRACLFSGTIVPNLHYGNPEAEENELWHACTAGPSGGALRRFPGTRTPLGSVPLA